MWWMIDNLLKQRWIRSSVRSIVCEHKTIKHINKRVCTVISIQMEVSYFEPMIGLFMYAVHHHSLTANDRTSCCLFMYAARHRTAHGPPLTAHCVAYSCMSRVTAPRLTAHRHACPCLPGGFYWDPFFSTNFWIKLKNTGTSQDTCT